MKILNGAPPKSEYLSAVLIYFDISTAEPDSPIWVNALKLQREFGELAWNDPAYALQVAAEAQTEHGRAGDTLVSEMVPGIMAYDWDAGLNLVSKLMTDNSDAAKNATAAIHREAKSGRLSPHAADGILASVADRQS